MAASYAALRAGFSEVFAVVVKPEKAVALGDCAIPPTRLPLSDMGYSEEASVGSVEVGRTLS